MISAVSDRPLSAEVRVMSNGGDQVRLPISLAVPPWRRTKDRCLTEVLISI